MNKTKILNSIGLAHRAGKVVTGEDSVLKAIRNNTAKLVILGSDTGINTTKRITDKSNFYKIDMLTDFTIDEISKAIGRNNRVVIAITNFSFKRMITNTQEGDFNGKKK